MGNSESSRLKNRALDQSRQRNRYMMQKEKMQEKHAEENDARANTDRKYLPDLDDLCFEHCEYRISER